MHTTRWIQFGLFGLAMVSATACSSTPATSADASSAVSDAPVTALPPEVAAYRAALQPVVVNKAREQSVEAVIDAGRAAAGKVYPLLGRLDIERWKDLKTEMEGYFIQREGFLAIVPEPDYFVRLSMEKGRKEDRDFFRSLKLVRPDGIHASYLQILTEPESCVRFGEGKALEAYGLWKGYRMKFPRAYRDMVTEEIGALRDVFIKNTCACGDKASVVKELSSFINRFQGDPLSKEVAERLQQVRTDRSGMRYKCRSNR